MNQIYDIKNNNELKNQNSFTSKSIENNSISSNFNKDDYNGNNSISSNYKKDDYNGSTKSNISLNN